MQQQRRKTASGVLGSGEKGFEQQGLKLAHWAVRR
jgi:hypothetical protein